MYNASSPHANWPHSSPLLNPGIYATWNYLTVTHTSNKGHRHQNFFPPSAAADTIDSPSNFKKIQPCVINKRYIRSQTLPKTPISDLVGRWWWGPPCSWPGLSARYFLTTRPCQPAGPCACLTSQHLNKRSVTAPRGRESENDESVISQEKKQREQWRPKCSKKRNSRPS